MGFQLDFFLDLDPKLSFNPSIIITFRPNPNGTRNIVKYRGFITQIDFSLGPRTPVFYA